MGDPDKIRQLYSTVSKDYDVGTYDEFAGKMQDSAKRKAFYDFASKSYDLGDYTSFESKVVKKKDLSPVSQPTSKTTTPSTSLSKDDYEKSLWANVSTSTVKPQEIPGVKEAPEAADDDIVGKALKPLKDKYTKTLNAYNTLAPGQFAVSESTGQRIKDNLPKKVGEMDRENVTAKTKRELNNAVREVEDTHEAIKQTIFPTAEKANEYLSTRKEVKKDNATDQMALQRLDEYKERADELASGDIMIAAVEAARKRSPAFNKQFEELNKQGFTIDKTLPDVTMGRLVDEYLQDPNVKEASQKSPELRDQYYNLKNHLLERFPEYGAIVVGNEMSRQREKEGKNNAFANVIIGGSDYMDKLAEKMYANNPQKLKLYNEVIKKDFNKYIDTPGFFDKFEGAIERSYGGTKKSVRELLGQVSNQEGIYEGLKEGGEQVQSGATGGKEIASIMGDMTGLVSYIAATGGVMKGLGAPAALADKTVVGLTFFGDEKSRARMKFPNDPWKQNTAAGLNTLAFVSLNNIFPAKKVQAALGEIRPAVADITSQLANGTITKEAAKSAMMNTIEKVVAGGKEFAKQEIKGASEMTALAAANRGLDKALGLKESEFNEFHHDGELTDTFKSMLIGNAPTSLLIGAGAARARPAIKDALYEMATNPKRYENSMMMQANVNPEAIADVEQRINNLGHLTKVKSELDAANVPTKQQKSYLLHALNERALTEQAEATVDPTIKGKLQEQIKKSQQAKESILKGKDIDVLPQEDNLTAKEQKAVSEISNDQELFDHFVKENKPGFATTLKAASEMENPKEGVKMGLEYMAEKAAENPKRFAEVFGNEITERMLDRVETKKLEEILDSLLETDSDNSAVPILDKLIEKRYEKEGRKEEEVEVQEETIEPKESSISVIKPGEIKQPTETIIIKPKEDAISIGKSKEASLGETPGDSKTMGERIPKSKESTGKEEGGKSSGEEKIGITHRQMDEVAKELGMPTYEKDPETVAEWDAEAAKRIASNENTIPDLLNKMREGVQPDKIEQRIMVQYIADLKAKINKNPTDALLAQMKRAKDLSNIVGGREVAKSLVARKGERDVVETISDALVDKMDRLGVERLTEKQKEETAKLFKEDQEVTKAYEEKIAKLEEENAKLRSEAEVKKMAASRPKTKKTHEEYAQERKDAVKAAREALLKVAKGGGGAMSSIPGAAQLAAIAPHVKKIVESYVAEGIDKLSEVVRKVHQDFKDLGVTEKDIHNIIAGVYNEKKATQRDLAIRMRDLQTEAKLINRLEELEAGIEPKSEKKKRQQNKEIADLKKQIDEHDLSKLAERKTRIQEQIKKVEEQIKNRDFAPEQKKTELKLDKEALELEDKLIEVRNRREYEKLKDIYANQSNWEKGVRYTSNILNVPRSLMSSMDFSAMLRQGIIPSISHPAMASRAAKEMFRSAFSQKNYDRWFFDLQKSPRFKEMNENGLALTDSTDPHLQAREELFMSNLAEKIPVAGSLVKGSERAYSMFLNKIRVDLYNRFADAMEKNGKTVQNSPEQYKEMAKYVNNSTGRGSVAKSIEPVIPLMNSLFFSPRLIASRINMLTYLSQRRFYKTVPAEVRKAYFKDMASFIGIGLTVLALAKLNGADVEDDPRSSDFGKIKSGNTRWDIWGGFQPYVRAFEQVRTGQRKSTTTGKIYELDGKGMFGQNRGDVLKNFFRGKLAPVPSMAVDMLSGRTMVGDRIVYDWEGGQKEKGIKDILKEHLLPMTITGMEEALKDQGTKAWFTVGIPSLFGIGTQSYESNKKK